MDTYFISTTSFSARLGYLHEEYYNANYRCRRIQRHTAPTNLDLLDLDNGLSNQLAKARSSTGSRPASPQHNHSVSTICR